MAVMVDVNVCCYALGVAAGQITDADEHWDLARASEALIRSLDEINLSAITWFEIHRGNPAAQAEGMARLRSRFKIHPVDMRVAERSAQLEAAARASSALCKKCFAPVKRVHCSACGNNRSPSQFSNDILMVATADVLPEVDALYTCDGGVVQLGAYVKNVVIKHPPEPPAEQMELEEIADIRKLAHQKPKRRPK
jgi:hypothetical protein